MPAPALIHAPIAVPIPGHLGELHTYETVLVYALAFGPLLLLAITVWVSQRRRDHEDQL